jgi:hypothetical protein
MTRVGITQEDLLSAWRQGIAEFNEGRYWNAHEYWERGWVRLSEPQKTYIQALIQVAAVFYLLEKGRERPARALCLSAIQKLSRTETMRDILPRIEIEGASEALRKIMESHPDPTLLKAVLLLPSTV